MRVIGRCLLLLAGLALAAPAIAKKGASDMRVMTYNIRLDIASDGANAWPHRKAMVASLVKRELPDLLGMQEVLPGQRQDLERALPEYRFLGGGRDDGLGKGEASPVAFRHERFELLGSGTIWLSETPDRPGKGWDAAFPRIATWAMLRDRESGTTLRVVNTHFDHVGKIARHQSAVLLSSWLGEGEWASLPTIVMGDFNSGPSGDGYRILASEGAGLKDARLTSREPPYGPAGTFNAFKIDSNPAEPIDHVFVSAAFRVDRYAVVTQHWGGRLPSDHYPVLVDLEFQRR